MTELEKNLAKLVMKSIKCAERSGEHYWVDALRFRLLWCLVHAGINEADRVEIFGKEIGDG